MLSAVRSLWSDRPTTHHLKVQCNLCYYQGGDRRGFVHLVLWAIISTIKGGDFQNWHSVGRLLEDPGSVVNF